MTDTRGSKLVQILNDTDFFQQQFLLYIEKRSKNPNAVWDKLDDEDLQAEFIAKRQWVQHHARTKLGMADPTMELAATIVNSNKALSFSKEVSENIFNSFMHFIAANETNPAVLNSLMTAWLAEGRSLTELDFNGITPLQTAVYTGNIISFSAIASKGVDITALDNDGLTPLHVIINKINDGSADISLLQFWLDADLPTDMVTGLAAKKEKGKTAVELAQDKGLVEATRLLGGNIELAEANSEKLLNIKMELIQQSYLLKISLNPELESAISDDLYKLLSHYLVENHTKISSKVFTKFLSDKQLAIKTNVLLEGKTPLQKCVELGYNDWALVFAKSGVAQSDLIMA